MSFEAFDSLCREHWLTWSLECDFQGYKVKIQRRGRTQSDPFEWGINLEAPGLSVLLGQARDHILLRFPKKEA